MAQHLRQTALLTQQSDLPSTRRWAGGTGGNDNIAAVSTDAKSIGRPTIQRTTREFAIGNHSASCVLESSGNGMFDRA